MVRAQRETPLVENEVYVFPTATFILACLLVGTIPPLLPGHIYDWACCNLQAPTTSCEYDVTGDGDILACH